MLELIDGADWANVEIGNSDDPAFWKEMRAKYQKVDLFLDNGGRTTMKQQRVAVEEMLYHVHSNGVYMCEDLSTSQSEGFGGHAWKNSRDSVLMRVTMVGLVHRLLERVKAELRKVELSKAEL